MLVDRKNFGPHRIWFLLFVAGTAFAVIWYAWASWRAASWPSGSSLPGFVCGAAAGLIILFEFALWPRKTLLRIWRIGRTQAWLRAHIWLGLLTVPLIVLHSWRELGGTLSTVLAVLFAIVIASGLFGLALQQFLPRVMTAEVPAETVYSQIGQVAKRYCKEAWALVRATCGPKHAASASSRAVEQDGMPPVSRAALVAVGGAWNAAAVSGAVVETGVAVGPVPNSELLRTSFKKAIRPYLLRGARSDSSLTSASTAGNFFRGLRDRLPPAAHPAVEVLEGMCVERRQFDLQARLQLWLHTWLWVHLPLSAALVVLMFVHVFAALKYW